MWYCSYLFIWPISAIRSTDTIKGDEAKGVSLKKNPSLENIDFEIFAVTFRTKITQKYCWKAWKQKIFVVYLIQNRLNFHLYRFEFGLLFIRNLSLSFYLGWFTAGTYELLAFANLTKRHWPLKIEPTTANAIHSYQNLCKIWWFLKRFSLLSTTTKYWEIIQLIRHKSCNLSKQILTVCLLRDKIFCMTK